MSILKIKDSQGNWVGVPTVKGDTGNGISSTTLNDDYTLTLSFTDGTTYTTPSIRGEKGEQGDPATSMEIHICSASEYDAETRIPTIANPNDKTFYLVPTEDGTSPDLFTEWVYVNNAWEMFGSAKIDLSNYVTNTDYATLNQGGVVKVGGLGIIITNGEIQISPASSSQIKRGSGNTAPINASKEHEATFYGLAKASGDTTQSQSDNPVGTYTDEAKSAIQTMLDVPSKSDIPEVNVDDVRINGQSIVESGVANIPYGSNDNYGLLKASSTNGIFASGGVLSINSASESDIKGGTEELKPLTPNREHMATFYGLAKAAGSDEKDSTLPVGTYTENAKSAIADMLNTPVTIDGTTPVINTKSGVRYVCGECATIDISTPESGIIDVTFTSGSTPTVLTVTPPEGMTMMWANNFDPADLDVNTTYEINIMDGCKGVVCSWT